MLLGCSAVLAHVSVMAGCHVGSLCRGAQLLQRGSRLSFHANIGAVCAAGAMLPVMSREDVDFFVHLEMYLRQENPPLCGRDHLAFRSAYFPVKDVVDGDLCEQYAQVRAGPAGPAALSWRTRT